MKLEEIIKANKNPKTSINYELIRPYIKLLNMYYKNAFFGDPVLLVTDVFNAASYVKIVDSEELTEAIEEYIESENIENENDEDKIAKFETIMFNSKMLKQVI